MLNIGGVVNIIGDILSVYAMTSNNGQNIVLGCHCLRIFFEEFISSFSSSLLGSEKL